jgi:hypothetical protein
VLQRVKEERIITQRIKTRKANWIGHILRRNCLLEHVMEGMIEERIEVRGRRGIRGKQLLDGLKKGRIFWKLKEEAQDLNLWRIRFNRFCGPTVGQTIYYCYYHLLLSFFFFFFFFFILLLLNSVLQLF